MVPKTRTGYIPPHELYTTGEEIANSITHGIGTILSIAGLIALLILGNLFGGYWEIASFSVYGGTLVLLYLASTLYHSFQQPRIKRLFQIFDHSAIFLLIAGTYTPFMLLGERTSRAWAMLGAVWAFALLGILYKAFFIDRFQRISALGYVFMGWLGVLAGRDLLGLLPSATVVWLAAGGVLYTVGLLFAAWRTLLYSHTVWHLFVLGGSICHYIAILHLTPALLLPLGS